MKAKNMIWRTSAGNEYKLGEMDEAHLFNILAYLERRHKELSLIAQNLQETSGLYIPVPQINGRDYADWMHAVREVLAKRVEKNQRAAEKTLDKVRGRL
jgi:hypothetical protein